MPSANQQKYPNLPIDPELAKLCDEGNVERYDTEIITSLGELIPRAVKTPSKEN